MDPRRDEPPAEPPSLREASSMLPAIGRALWFALGAICATAVALVVLLRPFARRGGDEAALPYETFRFANNSGVCQEYVALATQLRTSRGDAADTLRRLAPSLPAGVRPENLRVAHAFAPGDYWTLAVDTQQGAGDLAHAQQVASAMNAIPGTGIHFEGVFYTPRRLYESVGVLCMPHDNVTYAPPAPR